jgi:hypothetical protein
MPRPSRDVDVFLEVGSKRTFAGTIEWPGWCRAGRDETFALQALLEYGPRYARVMRGTRLGFAAPADGAAFAVVERLRGDATTDERRGARARAARRQAVDGSVLRPPRRLARPGSRLGDRGSRDLIGRPTFTAAAGTVEV